MTQISVHLTLISTDNFHSTDQHQPHRYGHADSKKRCVVTQPLPTPPSFRLLFVVHRIAAIASPQCGCGRLCGGSGRIQMVVAAGAAAPAPTSQLHVPHSINVVCIGRLVGCVLCVCVWFSVAVCSMCCHDFTWFRLGHQTKTETGSHICAYFRDECVALCISLYASASADRRRIHYYCPYARIIVHRDIMAIVWISTAGAQLKRQ